MKESTLDALCSQIISNEIAVTSLLQTLARADPAIAKALVEALRENNSRVPRNFQCARERVEHYVELLQNHVSTQMPEPAVCEVFRLEHNPLMLEFY